MIYGELKSFSAADCYNTSLSLIPADPTSHITMCSQDWDGDTTLSASGFSGVQTNTMYNVTTNPHSVALADHNLQMPDPLTNNFELETCDNSVESSQLPFGWPQESSGNNMLDSFMPLNHWIPKEEPVSSETCMNMDWKEAELQQSVHTVNLNDANEFQSSLKGEQDTSYSAPKPLRSMCKKTKNRSEADSRRRSIIAQKVKALKELLPGTLKGSRGNQESIVHDFTGYIKYLQLQLKELSRNRLGGGESGSSPLRFIEGYGHYHQDAQKFDESLEEIFGSLFEDNPAAAQEILKNNGLYTVPVTSFEAFLCKR